MTGFIGIQPASLGFIGIVPSLVPGVVLVDQLAYFEVLPANSYLLIEPIPFPYLSVLPQPVGVVVGTAEVAVLGNLEIDVIELL